MNPTQLRAEYQEYIDKHEFIPDHIKPQLKETISTHFRCMAQLIGAIELLYAREKGKEPRP